MRTFFCLIAIILIYLFVIKGVNIKTLPAKVKILRNKAKPLLTFVKTLLTKPNSPLSIVIAVFETEILLFLFLFLLSFLL